MITGEERLLNMNLPELGMRHCLVAIVVMYETVSECLCRGGRTFLRSCNVCFGPWLLQHGFGK
jgi:hypothetical protein